MLNESTTESKGLENEGGALPPVATRETDPRVMLWMRTGTRVPGATRMFRRYDRRARRGVFRSSAVLATMMLTSSVWGFQGGRVAINAAMRLGARLPGNRPDETALPRWFAAFNMAFNDGGRIARRMVQSPARMAESEARQRATQWARPKVVARIRRGLPEAVRHPARWPWLPFLVNDLGAAEATLAIRRGLREGLDLAAIERGLICLWRQHALDRSAGGAA